MGNCCGRDRVRKVSRAAEVTAQAGKRFGLRHLVPLILLAVYSLVGAIIFHFIEAPTVMKDEQIIESRDLEAERQLKERFWEIKNDAALDSREAVLAEADEVIHWYMKQRGFRTAEEAVLDFWSSLFYCGTIYTTIGYGTVKPRTVGGRIFTMVYALFGIPLTFFILGSLGNTAANALYSICEGVVSCARKIADCCPRRRRRRRPAIEVDDSGMPAHIKIYAKIPLWLAIGVTMGWMVVCSAVFLQLEEEWDYYEAFYFFFISLTTIGLGDTMPSKNIYLVACFGLVLIGLALVSMSIQIAMAKVQILFTRKVAAIKQQLEEESSITAPSDMHDAPPWMRPMLQAQALRQVSIGSVQRQPTVTFNVSVQTEDGSLPSEQPVDFTIHRRDSGIRSSNIQSSEVRTKVSVTANFLGPQRNSASSSTITSTASKPWQGL